jgi:uncharacterized membrane protein YoaK (UPF0700 family)
VSLAPAREPEPGHGHYLPGCVRRRCRAGGADPQGTHGGKKTEDDNVSIFQAWPRQAEIALAIALILQISFFAVWITATAPASLAYLLIALAAFAMGLQANAIRFLNVPGISTTAFTATYVDLASGLASWRLTRPSARRLAGTVVGVAAGGFLGDWMLRHAHPYGPIVPAAVTAVVIAIAWLALKPRARSGPAGQQDLPE